MKDHKIYICQKCGCVMSIPAYEVFVPVKCMVCGCKKIKHIENFV